MTGTVHVVGAGLAGLACATALAGSGRDVILYEATDHAGGRCRSWHDGLLDRVIDNGNHLILGANPECFAYLDRIGGRAGLITVDPVALPFLDLRDRRSWTLRPGNGPLPLWLTNPARRVPDSRLLDYLAAFKLAFVSPDAPVADVLPAGTPLTERLWKPLAVSILNTPYDTGSARLLWSVFRRTLLRGAEACRPWIAGPAGLSGALVDPALAYLARSGAAARFGARLKALERTADGLVSALDFGSERIVLAAHDKVVLAVPPEVAARLLPDLSVPDRYHAILNAHYRLQSPVTLPGGLPLIGLVGGVAEWLFLRGDVLSVTISAADALMDRDADDLLRLIWRDVAAATGLDPDRPASGRIVKEKRATFAATPDQQRRRPGPQLSANLLLAGDWTDTGLPATIEGAVQSGHRAAAMAAQ
ncbi:hydroxysqualene dehydroxylase HpnE [Niveispirillum cyanobacteriorum]|uniref:Phytoene dehydrogenase n=1 Tax=Niveispirillum cyanobacteriorum TaxID=1612173 RepID=A0A2K9N8K0_9PROT|nr:hydroxysqualene dehydroxylase HpnE [Niveispirillum cyanobacteriorum]AUN29414.1 phytoene dehydrogenase [Niveispirillum cyanobacteriorum]GGE64303.1 amine oxidase [Niveispirillum cyanobacteriorum]